ncbi:Succinate dehydrogenase assembly factor 2 mitochondrial [Microbotryomycetes sp. JL201]|nr:Succinate dehydrogenase assembly factor 2 mitochondrial [Microbotryomycetes sp. JL201]
MSAARLIKSSGRVHARQLVPRPRCFSAAHVRLSQQKQDDDLTHPALVRDPPASNPSSATDPWTLKPPPMPDLLVSDPPPTMDQLLASSHPEGRDLEEPEILRKRLVYESRKRGILEMDLILSTFAKDRLGDMTERQLREYDRFLTLPDWSIYYFVTGKAPAPEPWKSSWILNELLNHSANRGRTVRRMPDLPNRQ